MGKMGRACARTYSLRKSWVLVLRFSFKLSLHICQPTLAKKEREKWMCMLILLGYLGRRNKVLEEKMSLYSSGAGFVASEGRGFTIGFPGEENPQAGSNIMMVIKKMTKGTCL
uniref:Uncharacterized protein n=1 Tax=Micrurus carvalhoi TaxID=3147026 RepID=A0A2H6NJZ0_9SAUR